MLVSRFSEICDFYYERLVKSNPRPDDRLDSFIDGMKKNPHKYIKRPWHNVNGFKVATV